MRFFILLIVVVFGHINYIHAESGNNELLLKIENNIYPANVTYTAAMTIYRPGKEYKKIIKVYMQGYEKALIEFISPPKERDTRILMIDDDMWMYLPSIEKVIRLSGSVKVMGGEFIYDDIMRAKFTINYKTESIVENENGILLTLIAKNKGIAYEKIRLSVNPDTLLPKFAEFYTSSGSLLKRLTYSEPRLFTKSHQIIPSRLLMQLAASEDYKTLMEILDYNDNEIEKRIFTYEYLKKGM